MRFFFALTVVFCVMQAATVLAEYQVYRGEIYGALLSTAKRMGLPENVRKQLVEVLQARVDLQKDLRAGQKLTVVAGSGGVQAVYLEMPGHDIRFYAFFIEGARYFFDEKGQPARQEIWRIPVEKSIISSHFGLRREPVYGLKMPHTGVDFATDQGAPVYAVADGVVVIRDTHKGYGKYIELRHNAEFSTVYGHLSDFAGGLALGRRVLQGEVIGYVGSTGHSTGAHLHFELHQNEEAVNPMQVRSSGGKPIPHKLRPAFFAMRDQMDALVSRTP